ncbi:MAG: hypothetical protein JGK12_26685 [Microcoleus sp. PH2017_01_SCD_O_A]|uniref:hypothetical protein n=1 Tax=unclassified Microcoleus TaxID=2642155 RepID=UPI001D6F9A65|nr:MULTISPECIES: hypothetical protein [unclassified Microcoleus]MCC3430855.1 hypothetical protein [Microcoleus sp. PH2017_04_SCI_O_A]TAF59806.1 MAG: hypothetical protein EAZ59_27125 [Oscillatoriales cyanobacterium]MCC3427402.1 hypothetical protein [Microcoleus sp. PH2017_01_SCD_O_A]MCC3446320.1 hypothetical protein [Microcoleus sp. PH2017_09_SFU_O_A]MCC3471644.1 hypothetical protein [Microcoleus sp. PH2017_13_LAR_U_A]
MESIVLGIGHWELGIGHWALGIGHWASAFPGHWVRVVRNRVFWENTLLWRADWEQNPVCE